MYEKNYEIPREMLIEIEQIKHLPQFATLSTSETIKILVIMGLEAERKNT